MNGRISKVVRIGIVVQLLALLPLESIADTWAFGLGTTGRDDWVALETDSAGNIYAIGNFPDKTDFPDGIVLPPPPPSDIYYTHRLILAKISAEGTWEWAQNLPRIKSATLVVDKTIVSAKRTTYLFNRS